MTTTSNDICVIQQSEIGFKQININENQKQALYDLGFHNGREKFMSESQLNMKILSVDKLKYMNCVII